MPETVGVVTRCTLTRRQVLRGFGISAAGGLLAACAPRAASTAVPTRASGTESGAEQTAVPAPAAVAELDYWVGWGGNTPISLQTAADKFTAEINPNTRVTVTGGVGQEKVLTAIAGQTLPDMISNVAYMTMIARGVCEPITEYLNKADPACIEDIPEEFWTTFRWQGQDYGIPGVASFASHALGINVGLAEEAGLDPSNPPQTWDEVFEWHKTLTKFDDAGNLLVLGMDPLDDMGGSIANNPWFWPKSWGFDFFKDMEFDIDRPETVEIFETIKMFYDHVGAEKMAGFRSGYSTWTASPNSGFPAGAQAMIITGSWSPGWLALSAPDKDFTFTWMPVPANRKGKKVQTFGGHTVLISNTSKHPEESFEFERYLACDDEAADILFKENGFTPGRVSWWKALTPADYEGFDGMEFFIESLTGAANELWATEANPVTDQTNQEFVKAREAVIYGEITPAEAAKQMQENVSKALEDMLAG